MTPIEALQTLTDQMTREMAERGSIDWDLVDEATIIVFKEAGVKLSDFGGVLSDYSARRWFPHDNPLLASDTHYSIVYFVSTARGDLVKIGTTKHLAARLAVLKSSVPTPIRLEAAMPGSFPEERALHARFAGDRVRGEWFNRSWEIDAMIRLVASNHPELST